MANPNNLSNLIEEFDFYKNEESIERFVGGTGTKVYVAKVEVDGTPAKINTTWVKIYFSEPVLGLTTDNFLVAGANKDSVTDLNNDGLIYQVNISGYKVGNAREIHIAFATIPDEYDIEPDGVDVIIWRKEFDIVDVQPNGENRTVTTDAVDITIKPGLKGLVASNFTIENAEITKVEEILPPEEQPLLILKAQLDEIEQQIVEKRVEISNLNNQIRSANETTAPSLEAQHAVLEAELEALENQKKNIQEQIYSLMTIEDVVKEIDLLEQELATINETIANVKQQIDTASTSAPAESASPVETSDLATVFTTINNELMHQLTELQIARDNLVQQIDELRQVLRIKQEEAEEDRRREDKNRSNIADLQRRIAELQESIVRRQAEAEAIMAQISASTGSANISLTRQHAELLEQIAYEQSQLVEVEMQLQRLLYGNQGHQQVGEPELIADNDDAETVYRVHFTIADTVINGDVLRSAIIGTGESISPEEFGIQVFVHEKLRKWVQITNSEPQKIAITPGTYATIALDKPFVDDSKLMHIDQSQIIFDKAGDYEVTFSAEFDVSTTGYIEFKFAGAAEHTFRVPTAPGGASNLVTETFMLYDIKPEDLIYVTVSGQHTGTVLTYHADRVYLLAKAIAKQNVVMNDFIKEHAAFREEIHQPTNDEFEEPRFTYIVGQYDSLRLISRLYGVHIQALMEYNSLTDIELQIGQELLIPGTKPEEYFYIALQGDTYQSIAREFNLYKAELAEFNNASPDDSITRGQIINIPIQNYGLPIVPGGDTDPFFNYTVVGDDTLWLLSVRFGTTVQEIKELNNRTSDEIWPGLVLKIPGTDPNETPEPITPPTGEEGSGTEPITPPTGEEGSGTEPGGEGDGNEEEEEGKKEPITPPTGEEGSGDGTEPGGEGPEIEEEGGDEESFVYDVVEGDTLDKLAYRYSVTVDEIKELNKMNNDDLLVDSQLLIPGIKPVYFLYTAVSGDSFSLLAYMYNTTIDAIMRLNDKQIETATIMIDEVLKIPGTEPVYFLYTIQSGDSLSYIGSLFNTTTSAIKRLNNIAASSNLIHPNQVIKIPFLPRDPATIPVNTGITLTPKTSDQWLSFVIPETNTGWQYVSGGKLQFNEAGTYSFDLNFVFTAGTPLAFEYAIMGAKEILPTENQRAASASGGLKFEIEVDEAYTEVGIMFKTTVDANTAFVIDQLVISNIIKTSPDDGVSLPPELDVPVDEPVVEPENPENQQPTAITIGNQVTLTPQDSDKWFKLYIPEENVGGNDLTDPVDGGFSFTSAGNYTFVFKLAGTVNAGQMTHNFAFISNSETLFDGFGMSTEQGLLDFIREVPITVTQNNQKIEVFYKATISSDIAFSLTNLEISEVYEEKQDAKK